MIVASIVPLTFPSRFCGDDMEVMESSYSQQQFEEKRRSVNEMYFREKLVKFVFNLKCAYWKARG